MSGQSHRYGKIREPDADGIAEAARILRKGGLIGLPTETVYGLAADATNSLAVAKIFKTKARPRFNPLIIHVSNKTMAAEYAEVTVYADALMEAFWPGPLTLVMRRRENCTVSPLVSAGLETIAVRAPAHVVARTVIGAVGRPLAAPSANRSGRISPTAAGHVFEDIGEEIDMILDGGSCSIGIESTVVGVGEAGFWLLRPGAITAEQLEDVTEKKLRIPEGSAITAPGQTASHYAPNAPVRLNATDRREGEILIGFGHVAGDMSLSKTGTLTEAAANLFSMLREADALTPTTIAIAPIPDHGLGIAINDRLRRAAAERE